MCIVRFDNKNSLVQAMHNGINIFTGAGFSVNARDKSGVNLPLGKQLLEELHKNVGPGLKDLPRYCTVMEKTNREALYNYLTKRFHVASFDDFYLNLNLINIKGVYTTNIDDLIPQIIAKSSNKYVNEQHVNGDCNDVNGINYLPLHGYVQNPERGFVFSVEKIANIYNEAPRIWSYLSAAIEKYPTIFIGYNMNDTGVIEAITSVQTFSNAQKQKWIVLYNPSDDDISYFEALGFSIIISDTKGFLEAIPKLDKWGQSNENENKLLETNLRNNIVPKDSRNQTQRPIEDFYRGEAPIWNDILRNVIFRTSHFKTIENSVFDRKKHTIIIGAPISGKTTLAMQVAHLIDFSGVKLVFNDLNSGRADYICKNVGENKALIIVENFSDDLDAFLKIKSLPNVKLIGIDRSHNFAIISHLISRTDFDIINVTKLTDTDLQGIEDSIPQGLRKEGISLKARKFEEDDSIFEFVIDHVKGQNIKQRYKKFIQELEQTNRELAEFLVLCAYMHTSRVPLSMEVAYSYFDYLNYQDVLSLRQQLADFLKEDNAEELAQNSIDGYRPRSSISADAIIDSVSTKLFSTVLINLLDRVSFFKICNYKTFRKWGFDKMLISKAFPQWEDGKAFYEKAFLYDNKNPYVLQQGALYLSSKRKFRDAFDWIDKAKVLTGNKQFSIRNSHAIILFDANYNLDTLAAKSLLDQSMEILHRCYNDDMRRTFHAKTYADQALRYHSKYKNTQESISYLQQAQSWLTDELSDKPWVVGLNSLHAKITNILHSIPT